MRISDHFRRRAAIIGVTALAILVIVIALVFEPATRSLVASQFVCFGCHVDSDYDPLLAGSPSKRHPATPEGGDARCVDCHVPEGWVNAVFVYSHYVSNTDLFGHWCRRTPTRFPAEVTPIGKKAYRVRDRLLEYDSAPCRTCHIEAEIKPKRKRGQKAHKNALKNKETCILCHYNVAHREVDVRPNFGE